MKWMYGLCLAGWVLVVSAGISRAMSVVLPSHEAGTCYHSGNPAKLEAWATSPVGGYGGSPGGTTGLLVDGNGIPARYLMPDQGTPIPYLVDADALPQGITLSQALESVRIAMATWTEVTGVTFAFEGVTSFGAASPYVMITDGKLRIQLHNLYGFIPSTSTLGTGGRAFVVTPDPWKTGGVVKGQEFHRTTRSYVVLNHLSTSLQNITTFQEILCHEIGHALSLEHSSESFNEPDPLKRQSIMYYRVHRDDRGASLNSWDVQVIRKVHPPENSPPFGFDRIMHITTDHPTPPVLDGINEVELRGYDQQSEPSQLSLLLTNLSANNGVFSLEGHRLRYTPAGFFTAPALDPAGNTFYDRATVRFHDGTNASPPIEVRVLAYQADRYPSPTGDGIPDSWMMMHFGNANPAAGANRGAEDDYDQDGLTNREEFLLGSDPTDPWSGLRILSFDGNRLEWQASPYRLYEIQVSTNLLDWIPYPPAQIPTGNVGQREGLWEPAEHQRHFRIYKVP